MLSVISPAKKLDFENAPSMKEAKAPLFESQTKALINDLRKLKTTDIEKLMKISPKLSELNFNRYKNFSFPMNPSNSKPAAFVFQGDTYKGLRFSELTNADQKYAQKSLRILSGLYGLLSPMDLMQEYRLEMGTSFTSGEHKNLYGVWKESVTKALNIALKDHKALVNLASNEYFSAVDTNKLIKPVITPIFKEEKNGVLKIISFNAKRARGSFARFIIENKITEIKDLKSFKEDNYKLNKSLSTDTEFVFTR
jgi:cytoplasmic iron level regulating protein YaaA (DUF328/UPF0246 family)